MGLGASLANRRIRPPLPRELNWHSDLPPSTEDVWDMLAKVLMLRSGGPIAVTERELKDAAKVECEVALEKDGTFHFRRKLDDRCQ